MISPLTLTRFDVVAADADAPTKALNIKAALSAINIRFMSSSLH